MQSMPQGESQRNGRGGGTSSREGGGSESPWAGKDVFTTGEAAQICNVSQQTIIRCFDSGRLNGFRVPGSRFRRIPRADLLRFMDENDIPKAALEEVGGGSSSSEGGRPRILVVDDDPQILEVFVEMLEGTGEFEVRTARTGYDAGMLTERFRPDLIVLDYMLPDVNGNIVCSQLRGREEFEETKIVFVSGVVGHDEVSKLRAAGADAFIAKPFDLSVMLSKIRELLGAGATKG